MTPHVADLASARRRDRTLDFLRQGYTFSAAWRERRAAWDALAVSRIPTRLLGRRALLVRGPEGVDLFYDTSKVKRHRAMPLPVRGPLFGAGAVHGLDDEEHRHRKALMAGLAYDDAQVHRILHLVEDELKRAVEQWRHDGGGDVYRTAVRVYGRSAMRWAGLDVTDTEADRWSARLAQIVDGFGSLGPAHLRAWGNRLRCDAWATRGIKAARAGHQTAPQDRPVTVVAYHRGVDGQLLSAHTAAVELQNLIRPTIAVARFAAFAARALHENPAWGRSIAEEVARRGSLVGGRQAVAFAEEVRRVYPFVPMLPAFARRDFRWMDQKVRAGDRVLIDVVGTNRDERHWENPTTFDPRRFLDVDRETLPHFIPQGGGDVHTGHRCPGEKIAVGILAATISAIASSGLHVDHRNLSFRLDRLPTKPHRARVTP